MKAVFSEQPHSGVVGARRMIAIRAGVALAVALASLSLAAQSPAATYSIQERVDVLSPREVAIAPDGAVWAATATSGVQRVTLSGRLTRKPLGSKRYPLAMSSGIGLGPDGNIWAGASGVPSFAKSGVVRIESSGRRTFFNLHAYSEDRVSFAPGPDGNLWFVGLKNAVGRITQSGRVRYFKVRDGEYLTAITQGPDGAMWAVAADTVIRISTTGKVNRYFGSPFAGNDITVGPDGSIWVSGCGVAYKITRDKTATSYPNAFPTLLINNPSGPAFERCRDLFSITPGPLRDILFTAGYFSSETGEFVGDSSFGAISESGSPNEKMLEGTPDTALHGGLRAGVDGRVWMSNDILGLLALVPDQPVVDRPPTPTIHAVTVSPRFLRTQLRCAGNPGKLCAGAVTVTVGLKTLLHRRYAIAPFNRLYVRSRIPAQYRGRRAKVTMRNKDSLTGRVTRVSRVVKLR